jgi:hypothetical protein
MRKIRLRIHDPDDFFRKVRRYGDMETDEEDNSADFILDIKEGELPPRPPTLTYEETEE